MQTSFINIPLPGGSGRVPAMLYAPSDGAEVVGIVVLAPGSNGGCGPGVDRIRQGLTLVKSQTTLAAGSIYRRLGLELSDGGTSYNWRGHATGTPPLTSREAKSRRTITGAPGLPGHDESPAPGRAVAVLQISWRHTHGRKRWPYKKLKFVSSLEIAANDFVAGVHYMRATYGTHLPVVMIGFSFGGPAAWAAAAKLVLEGAPPTGIVLLAGAGRDGLAFQERQLDTLGCALRCRQAGVATLFIHGTADENVAFEVPQYFYNNLVASGDSDAALTLAVVAGSAHLFDIARDIVFNALKSWVLGCLGALLEAATSPALFTAGPSAVLLRGGGRSEPFSVKPVARDFLLRSEVKGYSEKERSKN